MIRVVAALTSPARWPTVRPLLAGEIVGTAGTRVVLIALGLASSIVTSRVLQPDGRGEYFWVVTIAQLLVQFSSLGLQSSNTYLAARDAATLPALLGNCIVVAVGLGGLLAAGTAAVLSLLLAEAPASIWVLAALAPAMLLHLFTTNLLVGIKQVGTFNRVQLVSNVVVFGCMMAAA